MLANGIALGPKATGRGFVDDNHPWGVGSIPLCEIPAFKQRNTHRAEVVGANDSVIGNEYLVTGCRRTSFHVEATHLNPITERNAEGHGSRLDSGYGLNPL